VKGNLQRLTAVLDAQLRVEWSPDGEWIVTSDKDPPLSPARLILIATRTGKKSLDYVPAKLGADLGAAFSPDGQYLAFARYVSPIVADIFVLEIPQHAGAHAEAKQLTHSNRLNRNPIWSGDGQEIFFIGDQPGMGSTIWRIRHFGRRRRKPSIRLERALPPWRFVREPIASCTLRIG
jgi:Tol biopolymer transport system component